MGKPVRELEPGSLYITISLQNASCDHSLKSADSFDRQNPGDIDIATYETHCAQDLAQEEFSWGLYFHRGPRDGMWYSLSRLQSTEFALPPMFHLSRHHITQSPRLSLHVVCLIRVLRIPRILCGELTWYLDWLAWESHGNASRTFIWVTSMYLRTWHHILRTLNNPESAYGAQFDVNRFLREALSFAYGEVKYARGGQLPRPILQSAFGTELGVSRGGIDHTISQ